MSKINPILHFVKSAGKPENSLLILDVDLAIQPSMSTATTADQREQMRQLYDITKGGVFFFTGRSHQSVEETFGQPYGGVFEHGCVVRSALGHSIVYVAPRVDVPTMGKIAREALTEHGLMRIAEAPQNIRESDDLAVYVEMKNTSMALVHTLKHTKDVDANRNHLTATRIILEPIAQKIIDDMGLGQTHKVKTGGDAVEIVPIGPAPESFKELEKHFSTKHVSDIFKNGVSKSSYVPCFQSHVDETREMIVVGDSAPDLDAGRVAGRSIYVRNNIPLRAHYNDLLGGRKAEESREDFRARLADGQKHFYGVKKAIKGHIDHHTMTWPMIGNTVLELRDSAPKAQMPLPAAGGMVPDLRHLN